VSGRAEERPPSARDLLPVIADVSARDRMESTPAGVSLPASPFRGGRRRETVSVVVCAYSEARWSDLCAALTSLRRQSCRPLEVVLVIDHCPALASRAARSFGDSDGPRVAIVENGGTPGLSNARNCGWQAARGSVVAFIDDDAAADPTWLEELLVHYGDERIVGVGGRVDPAWREGRPTWFPREFDWVVGCSHSGMPKVPAPVRNFVGANMSFRRSLLRHVGGFSPELGRIGRNTSGCEETEFCIRAAADGATLLYAPEATVHHSVPPGRATWRYFVRRCYSEGRSKAIVTAIVGPSAALSDERRYLRTTVLRGMFAGLAPSDPAGSAGRVLALVVGVTVTAFGYGTATLARIVSRYHTVRRPTAAEGASGVGRPRVDPAPRHRAHPRVTRRERIREQAGR
jgi:glucosyl-dolichyl phosphate glucuronosyltransferase